MRALLVRLGPPAVALLCVTAAGGAWAQADGRNKGVIELLNQVDTLNAEMNRLRGQVEELNNGIAGAQKRQKDMYLDLDSRLRRLEGDTTSDAQAKREARLSELDGRLKRLEQDGASGTGDSRLTDLESRLRRLEQALAAGAAGGPDGGAAVPSAATGAAAATVPGPATPTPPATPNAPTVTKPASSGQSGGAEGVRKSYDAAMNNYKMGDYQGAVAAFEAFVKRHPTDALAPNAQYWVGDAYFNLHDFRAAAAAQQALIKNYPDSAKVPDAMLNLGSAHAAMNDVAAARRTLEDLIARHPGSDAAEKAKQRLARMK